MVEKAILNPSSQDKLNKLLKKKADEAKQKVIDEFNEKYFVLSEAGKTIIYGPHFSEADNGTAYIRYTFEDFRKLYQNQKIEVWKSIDEDPIHKSKANVWLDAPDRRTYIGGATFNPNPDYKNEDHPTVFNLWEGFRVKAKKGDWSLLKDHVFNMTCRGNKDYFDYLFDWTALMFQRPWERGQVAVVLRGDEGAGKGIFAQAVKYLLGAHAWQVVQAEHLVGKFNYHLLQCVFLFADEAFFAGDKRHISILKALVTELSLNIEGKFMNVERAINLLHILMSTNEEWAIPASLKSRRWCVFDVLDTHRGDFAYFDAILHQLAHGGYEAMLHDLQHRDLSNFNVRDVPQTEALRIQRQYSLPDDLAWWQQVLWRGYVYKSTIGLEDIFGHWHEEVSSDLLRESYQAFAKENRHRHPLNEITFGKFMNKTGALTKKLTKPIVGETRRDKMLDTGGIAHEAVVMKAPGQKGGYHLGTLAAAREAFNEMTELKIEWPEGDKPGADHVDLRYRRREAQARRAPFGVIHGGRDDDD